jgi:hypothetical protein
MSGLQIVSDPEFRSTGRAQCQGRGKDAKDNGDE